jgi:hypothetical protein
MLKAVKLLIGISYTSLISFVSTFVPHVWNVGFDVRLVRGITVSAFFIAAVTARFFLLLAIHREKVARRIIAPFPYTTYPGIDSPGVVSSYQKNS